MTILEMMRALEDCGDATVLERTTDEGIVYDVILEDFEGFNEEWEEVCREYTREDLVIAFEDVLAEQALRSEGSFYHTYYFDGFSIQLGYSSYYI